MLQVPYLSRNDIHRITVCLLAFPGDNERLLLLMSTCCHMQSAPTAPSNPLQGFMATSDAMTDQCSINSSEALQHTKARLLRPSR